MKTSINRQRTISARQKERGTVLIFFALFVLTLVAFMGLAFDASYLYYEKRRVQTAADAGAMGGAQEIFRGNTTAVTSAARHDSALNRYTHGVDGVTVTVNNPPVSGTRAGNSGFVEVIVSKPQPSWFMRSVGAASSTVAARAVAGLTDSSGCVYALNRDTSNVNNGIFVNGTTNSSMACGVFSNAHFRTVGGGCVITPSASYAGSYSNASSADANCGPDHVGHGIPAADPMEGRFTIPATSPCDYNNYKETSGTAIVLNPGVYCGGIEIGGSVPSVTFNSGVYVLAGGGMKIGSGTNATGTAVTFFNTYPTGQPGKYRAVEITTSGTVSLTAPVAGVNKALLFYQDPTIAWASNNGSTITSGPGGKFEGIIYFPTTDLTYSGSSTTSFGTSGYTILVAYNLKISGNAQVNADFSSLGGKSPFQMAAFAE
jgi:hypothetical protein